MPGTVLRRSGGLTFKVDSGTAVMASCTGPSSPLTCTLTGLQHLGAGLGDAHHHRDDADRRELCGGDG